MIRNDEVQTYRIYHCVQMEWHAISRLFDIFIPVHYTELVIQRFFFRFILIKSTSILNTVLFSTFALLLAFRVSWRLLWALNRWVCLWHVQYVKKKSSETRIGSSGVENGTGMRRDVPQFLWIPQVLISDSCQSIRIYWFSCFYALP